VIADLWTLTGEAIRRARASSGGKVSQAARRLGVNRSTIYRHTTRAH